MSSLPNAPKLDACGCCEAQPPAPAIFNRLGQPALAYRIGVFESFLRRMLGELGSGPLGALTTRSSEDPSVALLDAWACVADVLTFYQERIANEGFLRTATEPRSVLELARAIGYELRPGVAAATFLAFTIESAVGSPHVVSLPKGTRVQSLPVEKQLPQTFETVEDIQGRAEWNQLRPRLSSPQNPGLDAGTIYLQGIALNLKPGDLLLLVDENLSPADAWVVPIALPRRIHRVTANSELQQTVVDLEGAPAATGELQEVVNAAQAAAAAVAASVTAASVAVGANEAATASKNASASQTATATSVAKAARDVADKYKSGGSNADPNKFAGANAVAKAAETAVTGAAVTAAQAAADAVAATAGVASSVMAAAKETATASKNASTGQTATATSVAQAARAIADKYKPGGSNADPDKFAGANAVATAAETAAAGPPAGPGVPDLVKRPFNAATIQDEIVRKIWIESDLQTMIANQGWNPDDVAIAAETVAKSEPPTTQVFAFRTQASVFGHNAPRYSSLPGDATAASGPKSKKATFGSDWDDKWSIWQDPNTDMEYKPADLYLDRVESAVTADDWLVLQGPDDLKVHKVDKVSQASLAGFAMSGHVTGLQLKNLNKVGEPFLVRTTTVYTQSESLPLATLPVDDRIAEGSRSLTLDSMTLGLTVGQRLALSGELSDTPGVTRQEIVVLHQITHLEARTTLEFQDPLANNYARKTVLLNANVARATHGETVSREVLGSGDGAAANQRFTLSKAPLTFVSAQTPTGVESTLELRVNEVLWTETPSLFGLGPRNESYALRVDDDAKATAIFGDSLSGSRLPSGAENVVATYRNGIGPDGEVGAGSLILLANPPLGVRSVTNPLAATGADGPEKLDRARDNAPRTVLTLDRIVSLADYEDFAGSFAGIGKAKAAILWKGETRRVHVTVSGAAGQPVDPSSDLYRNLLKAIAGASDISATVDVRSYRRRSFSLSVSLLVDPRYIAAKVLAAAEAALRSAFSFARRGFAQGVSAAEIVAVLQAIPGVVASEVDRLFLPDDSTSRIRSGPAQFLPASAAEWPPGGEIKPAELLLIDSSSLTLKEMKP